jgi:tetratricopeptide (TPR) repeat protein
MFLSLLLTLTFADDPHRDALTRYGAGVLKQRRDELPSARKSLESAVAADPTAAEPKRALFRIYIDLARYTAAVRTGRDVLELDPDDYKTALALGRVLLDGKQPREAAEVLAKAAASRTLSSDPATAVDVYSTLATTHELAGDLAKAEAALVALTAHHTNNAAGVRKQNHWSEREHALVAGLAWERLGLLRVSRAQPVAAATAFYEAEKLFAGPAAFSVGAARLHRNLARAFAAAGDHTKAVEQFRKYLASGPPGLEPLTDYADLLHAAGKDKDAAEEFTRLLAANPKRRGLEWVKLATDVRAGASDPGLARIEFMNWAMRTPDEDLLRVAVAVLPGRDLVIWYDELAGAASPEDKPKTKPNPAAALALRALSDAIRRTPAAAKGYVDFALADARTGRPRAFATYEFASWLADRAGQPDRAEAALRAGAYGPWDRVRPLVALLERQRRWREVVEACAPLLNGRNASPQAIYTAAYAQAELGNGPEALALVERLVRDDRLFAEGKLSVRMQQARVLATVGEAERAVQIAESLFEDAGDPGEVRRLRLLLSDCYFAAKADDKAEAQLRAILEEEPDDALALNNLGYHLADRGLKLAECESLCRRAVERDRDDRRRAGDPAPESGTYLDSLGWVLFRRGKYAEARETFARALTLPDGAGDPTIWDHYGDTLFRLGETKAAKEAWEKAAKGYPNSQLGRQGGRLAEVRKKLALIP